MICLIIYFLFIQHLGPWILIVMSKNYCNTEKGKKNGEEKEQLVEERQWNMLLKKSDHQFTHRYINVVSETPNFLPRPREGDDSCYRCVMLLQQVYTTGCNLAIVVLWTERLTQLTHFKLAESFCIAWHWAMNSSLEEHFCMWKHVQMRTFWKRPLNFIMMREKRAVGRSHA